MRKTVAPLLLLLVASLTASVAAAPGELPDAPELPPLPPLPQDPSGDAARTVHEASQAGWDALEPTVEEGWATGQAAIAFLLRVLGGVSGLQLFGSSDHDSASRLVRPQGEESSATFLLGYAAAAAVGFLAVLAAVARRFGWLTGLPLYSRIAKNRLLDNEMRSNIYTFIQENPGANVSEIARAMDLAWGTATHHLRKLRSERLVSIRRVNNQACYFENEGKYSQWEMDAMSALKQPTARRVALTVHGAADGATQKEISERLGISRAVTSFHVKKLEAAGVLARGREGREVLLRVPERVAERLCSYAQLLASEAPTPSVAVAPATASV